MTPVRCLTYDEGKSETTILTGLTPGFVPYVSRKPVPHENCRWESATD